MGRPEVNLFFREEVRERANGRCEICNSIKDKLYVHHRRFPLADYPEDAEDPDMVDVVCKSCHKVIHRREKMPRRTKEELLAEILKYLRLESENQGVDYSHVIKEVWSELHEALELEFGRKKYRRPVFR